MSDVRSDRGIGVAGWGGLGLALLGAYMVCKEIASSILQIFGFGFLFGRRALIGMVHGWFGIFAFINLMTWPLGEATFTVMAINMAIGFVVALAIGAVLIQFYRWHDEFYKEVLAKRAAIEAAKPHVWLGLCNIQHARKLGLIITPEAEKEYWKRNKY